MWSHDEQSTLERHFVPAFQGTSLPRMVVRPIVDSRSLTISVPRDRMTPVEFEVLDAAPNAA